MKRFLAIILILFFIPIFALADGDDWDKIYENDYDINKPVPSVTDKEFQEAYDFKMGKNKKKKNPYENAKGYDTSEINNIEGSYPSVLLYEKFYTDDRRILSEGFYKVVVVIPKEKNGKYFVHFYQGHTHKGKIQMYETNNDYDQPTINYAKLIDDNGIKKFIYGTIDCNLEGTLWRVED